MIGGYERIRAKLAAACHGARSATMTNVGGMSEERAIFIIGRHLRDLEEILAELPTDDPRRPDLIEAVGYLAGDLGARTHRVAMRKIRQQQA